MRLFIGIRLPADVAEALKKSAATLVSPSQATRIRWTPSANMHITLSFLGQVHEARRDVIEQALAAIRAPRMQLELNGIGTFERAGVVFADVKHTPELLAIAEHVIATMETCGSPREDRPYSPHVTLARSRDRLRIRSGTGHDPAFHQAFEATEFHLCQSLTLPGGAQYQVLRSFLLD
jgi:RNA 2',3'-cyclic 3'-phosphodiesterase